MSEPEKKEVQPAEAQKGKKEAPLVDPEYWAPRNAAFERALERYKKELEGLLLLMALLSISCDSVIYVSYASYV